MQGFGVPVGELRAGEVVAGHGVDQRDGFDDLVFVQLDGRRDHGGGVTDFVRPQQSMQSDDIAPHPQQTEPLTMLVHLPDGYNSAAVRGALITTVNALPPHLKRSLTWDQGTEMAAHRGFSTATNVPVYFCNPGSPWQRGSNENTNGLLRQYFPKGTDLSIYSRERLDSVAAELNSRPRKTLGWATPADRLHELTASPSNYLGSSLSQG